MPGDEGAEQSADISSARSGALFALPPPPPLNIHDSNTAEKWKEFEEACRNYSVFSTFTFGGVNRDRIQPVLASFAAYCQPLKNVPFERYKF